MEQTLLYQVAMPGLYSSGGTGYGIRNSTGCFIDSASMNPAPAPTLPAPTSFKNFLRSTFDITCSKTLDLLVAGQAVETMLDMVFFMAI